MPKILPPSSIPYRIQDSIAHIKKESDLPISLAESIMSAKIDTVFPPYIEGDTHHIIKVLDFQQRPDSIEMSQMLVSYSTARAGFQLNERSEEEAKVLVDSILTALKKRPLYLRNWL